MWDVSGIIDRSPLAGLLLLLVLGAWGFPFPEDMTLILGGFLIANRIVKPLPLLMTVYLALLGIDIVFFYAGRKYGPGIINRGNIRKIISPERLAYLEDRIRRWGVLLIVLGRHLIVLRTQLIIATGVFRMPPAKFFIADAIAIPLTMLIMIGMGYLGAHSLEIVKKDITRIEHVAVLVVITLLMAYLLYSTFKKRS